MVRTKYRVLACSAGGAKTWDRVTASFLAAFADQIDMLGLLVFFAKQCILATSTNRAERRKDVAIIKLTELTLDIHMFGAPVFCAKQSVSAERTERWSSAATGFSTATADQINMLWVLVIRAKYCVLGRATNGTK